MLGANRINTVRCDKETQVFLDRRPEFAWSDETHNFYCLEDMDDVETCDQTVDIWLHPCPVKLGFAHIAHEARHHGRDGQHLARS